MLGIPRPWPRGYGSFLLDHSGFVVEGGRLASAVRNDPFGHPLVGPDHGVFRTEKFLVAIRVVRFRLLAFSNVSLKWQQTPGDFPDMNTKACALGQQDLVQIDVLVRKHGEDSFDLRSVVL